MKNVRQLHLYLGCFFAPMILYFSVSGVWQVFRWNDLPRVQKISTQSTSAPEREEEAESATQKSGIHFILHELSKPHKESTAPGSDPDSSHSNAFDWLAAAMGIGLCVTTLLGVVIAWQMQKKRKRVAATLVAGVFFPLLALWIAR